MTEYLLGCDVDDAIRDLLIHHKDTGGFEAALDALQQGGPVARLRRLEAAVGAAFEDMNRGYRETPFEFSEGRIPLWVKTFLTKFDAIFTLNQDTLLECRYFNESFTSQVSTIAGVRWKSWRTPGMKPVATPDHEPAFLRKWEFTEVGLRDVGPETQPYYKLHGSSNWLSPKTGNLLIMGGNKSAAIGREPVLQAYMEILSENLSRPETRLMIIGYGFRDDHINKIIVEAAEQSRSLKLFIVDPQGIDVVNWRMQGASIPAPSELAKSVWPLVHGASRRNLSSTFSSNDPVEHKKLMRFLD